MNVIKNTPDVEKKMTIIQISKCTDCNNRVDRFINKRTKQPQFSIRCLSCALKEVERYKKERGINNEEE